jgi:hypothetical protein
MNSLLPVSYALRRQQLAVQRVIRAATPEESLLAARWADAWHRLVQRRLDRAQHVEHLWKSGSGARRSPRTLH